MIFTRRDASVGARYAYAILRCDAYAALLMMRRDMMIYVDRMMPPMMALAACLLPDDDATPARHDAC